MIKRRNNNNSMKNNYNNYNKEVNIMIEEIIVDDVI